jgi:uncharacterized protein
MSNGILDGYDCPAEFAVLFGIDRATGLQVQADARMLNRHGAVTGATGTGKSRTIQLMTEWLSERGISVLLSDGKGDMSGLCVEGELTDKQLARTEKIGQDWWAPTYIPTEFIALGGNGFGVPARFTVGSFGHKSLSRLLGLSQAQTAALANAYGELNNDSRNPTETLADLCAVLRGLRDDPDKSLTEAMCARVIDKIETFDRENPNLFGGPEFDIMDLIRHDDEGYGHVSIIDSSKLLDTPEVMTTALLWMLDQLNKHLPEVGDSEIKLVCLLDEAHTIFEDAPKEFIRVFVSILKRLRSKGVGVILCSQQLSDIPEAVLAQCGLRIQHTVRVNTPKAKRQLNQTVDTFPDSKLYNIAREMMTMPVGTALVCIMDENGIPTDPSVCQMFTPRTSMEIVKEDVLREIARGSDLAKKYARMAWERDEAKRRSKQAPTPLLRPRPESDEDSIWEALQHARSGSEVSLEMDEDDAEAARTYLAEHDQDEVLNSWS